MSSGAQPPCLYLVDAHSLIFQVFHGIQQMSSPTGVPTNALFGFTRDLLYLRAERRPDYLVIAFDVSGPTFREKEYPAYKANRGAMPDDLSVQIPLIHRLLEGLRLPVVGVAGFEADDVIATLARAGAARELDVFICSGDKDCRQLLNDKVRVFNLRKREVYDGKSLEQDWGIAPAQVVDFQTLVGDSVDNVPGVPGIGEKTAAKLLQEHGSLDKLLEAAARVTAAGPKAKKEGSLTPRLAANLVGSAKQIEVSRKLVRLVTEVPVKPDWDAWKMREWDAPALLTLFREAGFRGFAEQVQASAKAAVPAGAAAAPALVQGELFPFGANAPAPEKPDKKWQATYHLVNTPALFKEFLAKLKKQKRFAVDSETTGLDPLRSDLVGLAFSWQEGEGWYLAVRGPAGEPVLDEAVTLDKLRPLLEDPTLAKVNQNIKYDQLVLRAHGIALGGVVGDPMVADYLLHAGERSHNLEELSNRYLNHQVIPITDLIGKGKNQVTMAQVPTARVAEYSGEDADVAWRLVGLLEPAVEKEGLLKLYQDLEVPLIEVLAELEYNGIRVDVPILKRLGDEMGKQLEAIEQEIHKLAGQAFNIASPKQLREVLFTKLKLPVQRKTGITGEASTDQETLEKLAALGHALPRKILEHRQIAKLKGTYVDALPDLVNPKTGRIHASFNQTVASTGRLSSSDPNLQNIPVRREQGRQIRQAFIPEPGWVLLTADYSQIELRLLAHFCGDAGLRRAFAENRDVHAAVAAQIFNVSEAEVSAEQRRMAKTVNFGVIYGISPRGLGQRLGMTDEAAAKFIDAYFARYPKVQEYQARVLNDARRTGYVGTILGRRRKFDPTAIRSNSTYQQRNQAEREAINMEIQGSAADLMKLAMLNVFRRLKREERQARMLLQIHDELVFEVPPKEIGAVAALVREEMTTPVQAAMKLEVPLQVDLSAGPNWLDVEEIKDSPQRHEEHKGLTKKTTA
jgi:DNA polymerase-1